MERGYTIRKNSAVCSDNKVMNASKVFISVYPFPNVDFYKFDTVTCNFNHHIKSNMVSIKSTVTQLQPINNTPKALFFFCVKIAKEKGLLDSSFTHMQWANLLFYYVNQSYLRTEFMSKVKREYNTYFTHTAKYAFEVDKIKRDFPFLFGLEDQGLSEECTCEDIIREVLNALSKEIIEQSKPENIESFKGSDLCILKKNKDIVVYSVKLSISQGQEPHFHEGTPFTLKVFNEEYLCEVVDYDYENGLLFFTSRTRLRHASFCTIVIDTSFILLELKNRLAEIAHNGINDALPITKFFFDETRELRKIQHAPIPHELKKNLDSSQIKAFEASFDNDITFIWGPPGTGKSFTLASIIYTLYKLGEERTAICCLSNVAVDQLLCKVLDIIDSENEIVEPGNIYRAGRTLDNRIVGTNYLFPKNEYTEYLRESIISNSELLQMLKKSKLDMSEEAISIKAEIKELREKLREQTESLVNSSRIVFSTISNFVLNSNLYYSSFDNLIVDEASMLSMPSLIALGKNISKRLIMVGDFQQLSPIALVKDEYLTNSVFEMSGISINATSHPGLHQLLHQRRSNTKIVELINPIFYNDKLISTLSDTNDIIDSYPFKGKTISVLDIEDGAVRFTKGGTRQNKASAEAIINLLDEFFKKGNKECSIGIITPYKGQVSLFRALMYERKYPQKFNERVKIGTIHTFQGSECDVIIFDMVDCSKLESGRQCRIGRIYAGEAGERLINVAVSRAKHKLIVVGETAFMREVPGNIISAKTRSMLKKFSRYNFHIK